jgi:hypothetical protein
VRNLVRFYLPVLLGSALIAIGLFPHGFNHIIGVDTQGSVEYAFFSGFGAWLSSTLGLSTIVLTLWHHLNCHVSDCLRVGKYSVADGQYKVCGKHHNEVTGRHHQRLTTDILRVLHHESTTK